VAGEVGETIPVGSPLVIFETSVDAAAAVKSGSAGSEPKTAAAAAPAQAPTESGTGSPTDGETSPGGKVKTSPSIRQRAREANIDLSQVPGTGPRGRITKADFEAYAANPDPAAASSSAAPSSRTKATGQKEFKVIGLRRKIAQRMQQSSQEIPHFAYVEELDITALEALRQELNSTKSAGEGTLTLLPFIGLAMTRVLRDFPQCNAHYNSEQNTLIQHHAVNLGIATQTNDGLKVPVVHHAEARSLEDLAAEIRRVTGAARDNSASREDLSGSTITLTSLGKLGGVVSTPIINQPEVAIIGVNKAVERPVVINGSIAVRLMMNLSSSFDHRFVDGYDAAAMIQAMKRLLEHPALIFMD